MCREIILSNGKDKALVDEVDYEHLTKFKWDLQRIYAVRHIRLTNGKWSRLKMHREILNAPKGVEIDHINGNGLDNRRENLRFCNRAQNTQNQRGRSNTTSKYKGVYWKKDVERWAAQIRKSGKQKHLGYFVDEKDAAQRYDQEARIVFGEFAWLNFPVSVDDTT